MFANQLELWGLTTSINSNSKHDELKLLISNWISSNKQTILFLFPMHDYTGKHFFKNSISHLKFVFNFLIFNQELGITCLLPVKIKGHYSTSLDIIL